MISLKFFAYIFFVCASLFFILNDTIISRVSPPEFEQVLETEEPPFSSLFNSTDSPEIQKQCILPKLDPWDLSIKRFFNSHKNPKLNCTPSFKQRSSLDSKGILRIIDVENQTNSKENCFYRCLFAVSDRELEFGNWTRINRNKEVRPKCDVFDVQCNFNGTITYKFMHTQIFEEKAKTDKIPLDAPDFHMIVIDSVSMSQFFRSMPITTHFLRNDMDAIIFPYLNKVGLNSRPNGYGFLLGERAEALQPNPWGKGNSHGRNDELCKNALDKENFIMFDFQKKGYKTMMDEDWAIGIFNWPHCTGFTRKPVDHFMKPFALRYDGSKKYKDSELQKNLFSRSCKEQHDYMLDILQDFINKYPNQPKMSLSWMTALAHDDINGLFHVDQQFKEFFALNKQKLANSFLIIMADHGGRTGTVRQTIVGETEDNNPFFTLILPEKLRLNNDMVTQLYKNSREIITHYDLYATFLEIANKASTWTNETKVSDIAQYESNDRKLIGSSLFHSLKQPRTCETLQIPFTYCICQHNYTLVDEPIIVHEIAEQVVSLINEEVAKSEYSDKCAELSVDKVKTMKLQAQEFDPIEGKRIFRASLRVLPSGGLYDAFAEYKDGKVTLISKKFPRHDRYALQTKCIAENFIRNYCFCKDLLKEEIRV